MPNKMINKVYTEYSAEIVIFNLSNVFGATNTVLKLSLNN